MLMADYLLMWLIYHKTMLKVSPKAQTVFVLFKFACEDRPENRLQGDHLASCMLLSINCPPLGEFPRNSFNF